MDLYSFYYCVLIFCFLNSGIIYFFTIVRLIIKLIIKLRLKMRMEKENSVSRMKSCLEYKLVSYLKKEIEEKILAWTIFKSDISSIRLLIIFFPPKKYLHILLKKKKKKM